MKNIEVSEKTVITHLLFDYAFSDLGTEYSYYISLVTMETTENDIFIACNSSTELQRKSRLNKKHKKATQKNTSNKDFNNGAIGTFIPLNHFTN